MSTDLTSRLRCELFSFGVGIGIAVAIEIVLHAPDGPASTATQGGAFARGIVPDIDSDPDQSRFQ